jgi:hypothetical protein
MDDLVKRLRNTGEGDMYFVPYTTKVLIDEAADRLEQIKELYLKYVDISEERAARIKQLEQALAHIYAWYPISVTQPRQTIDDIREFAKAALGEKKDD